MFLVIGVKVWRMMRGLNLDEHADNNPKESAKLRHVLILLGSIGGRKKLPLCGVRGDHLMRTEEKEIAACNYTDISYVAGYASNPVASDLIQRQIISACM